VIAQLVWARRLFASGHRVRAAAGYAMLFMAVEVLIGAAIVKLHYVADNQSIARAWWMAIHLCNTFLLLGALTLTAHWSGGAPAIRFRGRAARLGVGALAAMLITGATGGIAALGDTLQPASNTGGAVAQLSATGELLVQLRIMHPFVACGAAMFILFVRHTLSLDHGRDRVATWGRCVRVGIVTQVFAGFLNVMMLAPTWMQLVHLLLADAVWIALVLFLAEVTAIEPIEDPPLSEATENA